jgi:hypothetical protein
MGPRVGAREDCSRGMLFKSAAPCPKASFFGLDVDAFSLSIVTYRVGLKFKLASLAMSTMPLSSRQRHAILAFAARIPAVAFSPLLFKLVR